MSDYRRLISYIYAYEGGIKGKNIGFAKIDMRGPQCRIQVNVKKVYVGSSDIGVYLLYTGGELLLGRIFIRGGAGEFRTQVQSENVDDSGIRMEDCYGLTIHDVENAWQSYTTIWEDAVAQTAELQLAEITAENIRRQQDEREKQEQEHVPEQNKVPEEPLQETAESENSQETKMMAVELPISAEIERELEREEQKQESIAPWGDDEAETKIKDEVMETVQQQDRQPVVPAVFQKAAEPDGKSADVSKQKTEENPTKTEKTVSEIFQSDDPEKTRGPEDAARLAELDREENEELADTNIWQKMSGQYTKVLAFDYDNSCEILSIKPQDIGLLPRETWVYGNNSFLLHGYYNYRHLILAKLQDPQKPPRYLLGVPGHYFSNEKYMASMFGFPHFVLARKQPQGDGRFGYWYTDIRL